MADGNGYTNWELIGNLFIAKAGAIAQTMQDHAMEPVGDHLVRLQMAVTSSMTEIGELIKNLKPEYSWVLWAGEMESEPPGASEDQAAQVFHGMDALLLKWKEPPGD
ncbi:unnamed protein product [marine sediment metagenome]|uniref:Uncharacterized protein n=1 Tax=marine sediment metagenome TaxID=412755 RepID=X1N4Z6_9ZZZZ